jgi:hypothetical protein
MILYRPVGLKELELIAAADYRSFPPRLPAQPIFYPVLNFEYAAQIARDWNTEDPESGYAGFVLQFEVDDVYVEKFPIQKAGSSLHQELWVPAGELDEFNSHILGKIVVQASFFGPNFQPT